MKKGINTWAQYRHAFWKNSGFTALSAVGAVLVSLTPFFLFAIALRVALSISAVSGSRDSVVVALFVFVHFLITIYVCWFKDHRMYGQAIALVYLAAFLRDSPQFIIIRIRDRLQFFSKTSGDAIRSGRARNVTDRFFRSLYFCVRRRRREGFVRDLLEDIDEMRASGMPEYVIRRMIVCQICGEIYDSQKRRVLIALIIASIVAWLKHRT